MQKLITFALIGVFMSGCSANFREAEVDIYTDSNGRVSRMVVVKSTGDRVADNRLKQRARENFYRDVSNPRKNSVYHQPARVHFTEPLLK